MDLNYLFHRQQVERTRAEAATSLEARIAHETLARCYEAQINQMTGKLFFPDSGSRSTRRYSFRR
jgi:hypothetical protein